jgi:hypothetical protein
MLDFNLNLFKTKESIEFITLVNNEVSTGNAVTGTDPLLLRLKIKSPETLTTLRTQ